MGAATQLDLFCAVWPESCGQRDPTREAQAAVASTAQREVQAKYRGESIDDGDLGSLDDEPREPHRSFYHPYG